MILRFQFSSHYIRDANFVFVLHIYRVHNNLDFPTGVTKQIAPFGEELAILINKWFLLVHLRPNRINKIVKQHSFLFEKGLEPITTVLIFLN